MFKRYHVAKHRGIAFIILMLLVVAALLNLLSWWMGWMVPGTATKTFLGIVLVLVFGPVLLIGAVYREVFYLRTNYADYYTSPYEYLWGMTTNAFIFVIGVCLLVSAATGWDVLAWMRIFSR